MVAAIGEQILGPTDVSLSNWTVRPSSGCSVVRGSERGQLHPDPGGEPVEHCAHLQLDPGPRAALRLPLPARHGLQLRGVHVRATTPCTAASWATRGPEPRPRCTSQCLRTGWPSCTSLPGLPNQTAGTVDVYGLWTQPWRPATRRRRTRRLRPCC